MGGRGLRANSDGEKDAKRKRNQNEKIIRCSCLGGALGACYVACVIDPQWQAPSPPELKPYVIIIDRYKVDHSPDQVFQRAQIAL
jgi:hypothetical protein